SCELQTIVSSPQLVSKREINCGENKSLVKSSFKHPLRFIRFTCIESVTFDIKLLELLWLCQCLIHGVTRHQSTCTLGVKRNDLVATSLPVHEHRRNHRNIQQPGLDDLEVFL